jgi:hypothetical protein
MSRAWFQKWNLPTWVVPRSANNAPRPNEDWDEAFFIAKAPKNGASINKKRP